MSQNNPFTMRMPLALLFAARLAAAGQDAKPAANGAYTAIQADRGRAIVENHCSECHGTDLRGAEGPALVGDSFMLNWESRNVGLLFRKIRDTMPTGAITSVTDAEKVDAIAYVMQQNGFPDGATDLPQDADALGRIPMSRQAGPAALRPGSLVRVIGCLSEGAGNAWMLTSATEPRPATAAEPQKTDAPPLGTGTLRLLNVFPDPSAHKGHRIEVSGLLVGGAGGAGVNVLSLEMVAPSCEK